MLRVFVSSVQKELEDERVIVQNLLNTDSFLTAHCALFVFRNWRLALRAQTFRVFSESYHVLN